MKRKLLFVMSFGVSAVVFNVAHGLQQHHQAQNSVRQQLGGNSLGVYPPLFGGRDNNDLKRRALSDFILSKQDETLLPPASRKARIPPTVIISDHLGRNLQGDLSLIAEKIKRRAHLNNRVDCHCGFYNISVKFATKGNALSGNDLDKIVEIIRLCGNVNRLDMSNTGMDDFTVKAFVDKLCWETRFVWGRGQKVVNILDLSNNNITDAGCQYSLVAACFANCLNLCSNPRIGPDGERMLRVAFDKDWNSRLRFY